MAVKDMNTVLISCELVRLFADSARRSYSRRRNFSRSESSSSYRDALRGQLRVQFVDTFGATEPGIYLRRQKEDCHLVLDYFTRMRMLSFAGVDGGGLLREFLEKTIKTGLNESFGLFERAAENTVYPCPSASITHENGFGFRCGA